MPVATGFKLNNVNFTSGMAILAIRDGSMALSKIFSIFQLTQVHYKVA